MTFGAPVIGAVLNIILCIIDNSSPSISVALVAGIRMGKEKEIYIRWGEMCTREEGRERNAYIYSRGGGGGVSNKI